MSDHHPPAPPLPGLEDTGQGPAGRVQAAVTESVAAANLGPLDRGAGALAIELARAVDTGSRRRDPFAVAQAAGPLRDQLIRLKLDPAARQDSAHDFAAWLDSLDTPPADHPDDRDPAVSHREDT